MGEFFHGWRRKAGLVTLAMALVSMVGWFRSYTAGDGKVITLRSGWQYRLFTQDGDIWFICSPASGEEFIRIVPCWAPTLSFTVFATYLILWKPRKAK